VYLCKKNTNYSSWSIGCKTKILGTLQAKL
jgi:hypothetical protein